MKNQGYNPTRTGQESCALESSSKQSLFFFLVCRAKRARHANDNARD